MKATKRILCLLLAFCMVFSLTTVAFAESAAETEEEEISNSADFFSATDEEGILDDGIVTNEAAASVAVELPALNDSFLTMVMLDCGRGYYTVSQVKTIIDSMASNGYDALMLAVGNDGLRFLLNDMSVKVGDTTYDSDTITNAIIKENAVLEQDSNSGEWSETDVADIISYANNNGISVIPMLNTPGHATSIVKAMEACGIDNCYVDSSSAGSGSSDEENLSVNVTNSTAAAFAEALVIKYIDWFAEQGCTAFNLGCDEYGGNSHVLNSEEKTAIVDYVNVLCTELATKGMSGMAFSDVLSNCSGYPANLIGINWNGKELSYKNINANSKWYYNLGREENTQGGYGQAINTTETIPVNAMRNSTSDASSTTTTDSTLAGSMLCIWDDANIQPTDAILTDITNLISMQASSNPTYFTVSNIQNVALKAGESATYTPDGEITTVPDSSIATAVITTNTEKTTVTGYTGIGNSITKDGFVDGETYIFKHKSDTYLKSDLSFGSSYASVDYVWVAHVNSDGTVAFSNKDGQYMNFNNAGYAVPGTAKDTNCCITLSDTPQYFTVDSDNSGLKFSYVVDGKTYYLNKHNDSAATGFDKADQKNNPYSHWTVYEADATTEKTSGGSVLTITGVSAGTTTAVVGTTTYNITVTVTPDTSASITIYQYISGNPVWDVDLKETYPASSAGQTAAVNAGKTKITLNNTDSDLNSEAGVELAAKVPEEAWWIYASESTNTLYWKGVVHNEGINQNGSATNYSANSGYDFKYIRYQDKWQTSMDGDTWADVPAGRELVAYYLQKTSVTTEVNTYVSDWAFKSTDMPTSANSTSYMKALSFAVVYPDKSTNPTEANIYSTSTLLYWDRTPLRTLYFDFSEELLSTYEVEKITYTFGTRTDSAGNIISNTDSSADGNYHWTTTDGISWNKTTDSYGNSWYDETTCWDQTVGGDPIVDGTGLMNAGKINMGTAKGNGVDSSNTNFQDGNYGRNQAILILVYLKVKESEDNLHVQYWDDNANVEITKFDIAITNKATEDPGTFVNRLIDNEATVVAGEKLELDDKAYVVNAAGTNRYIQKDLTKLGLTNIYASGLYGYVKTMVSEDGKTLILHYNLDSKNSAKYVIDFGLPVEIPLSDVISTTNLSEVIIVSDGAYGTSTVNGTTSITYTPNTVLPGVDSVGYKVKYTGDTKYTNLSFSIYPATTVFYEEGFMTTSSGWSDTGSKGSGTQKNELLGSKTNNYGYDGTYSSATAQSNGTQATSTAIGDTATFDFTGTGIDLYGNLDTNDAYVVVKITSGSAVKAYSVIDAKLMAGKYAATSGQSVTGYNVPIYSKDNLDYGTYTVTLTHKAAGGADAGTLNIDGFRVYKTLSDTSVYVNDKEDNPVFVELRDLALDSISLDAVNASAKEDGIITVKQLGSQVYTKTVNNTMTVDGKTINVYTNGTKTEAKDETVTAYAIVSYAGSAADTGTTAQVQEDLVLNGPKNEIYLSKGSTLTLTATTARTLQIGLKGVNGQATCTIKVGTADAATKTVSTVEMFYPVGSGTIVITNTGDNLLAVTKLKASDEVTISPVTEETIVSMLEDAGFEDAAVTADATLVLSLKTSNGKLLGTTTLYATGDVGTDVTFSKTEIKKALKAFADANGIKLNSRNSYKEVTVAVGSSTAVSYYGSVK